MAIFGYNPRTTLGQNLATAGSLLRLPELGLSERFGGVTGSFGQTKVNNTPSSYAQGQTLGASSNALPPLQGPQPMVGPQMGLPQTGATGNAGNAFSGGMQNAPMEPMPQQQGGNYDAMIQPAMDALNQAIAPLQSGYQANIASIDANTQKQTGQANANLSSTEKSANQSIQRNTQGTESAIDEARRQYSEIGQGIQSRYGGTTGTGKFATEVAGAQALKNIGAYRTNLNNAVTQINDSLEQTRTMTQMHIQDLESQSQAQKLQAKSELDNGLNQIRQMQGQLLGQKAQMAQEAVQQYQQQIQAITARNTQFQQQLYQQQLATEQKLNGALSQGENARKQFEFMVANGTLYKANPFTGEANAVGGEAVAGGGKLGDGFIDDEQL